MALQREKIETTVTAVNHLAALSEIDAAAAAHRLKRQHVAVKNAENENAAQHANGHAAQHAALHRTTVPRFAVTQPANQNGRRWVVLDRWPGALTTDRQQDGHWVMTADAAALLSKNGSTAILSSRLPKILDDHQCWFDAIRTIGTKMIETKGVLLTAPGTTADRYVRRIAELFSIQRVTVVPIAASKLRPQRILDDAQHDAITDKGSRGDIVYYVSTKPYPTDQLLAQIADTLYGLAVVANGNVATAVQHRIAKTPAHHRTYLLNEPSLSDPTHHQRLINSGGIDWLLRKPVASCWPTLADAATALSRPNPTTALQPSARQRSINEIDQSEYLIHWTRARVGPWPEQTEDEHVDDLIFGLTRSKRSEVGSLCRILATQRIVASSELLRGSTPVVCFSQVPLSQIKSKTVYRKHLQRWDFVPYGVGIKRSVLEKKFACRPVIYGNDQTWQSLSPSQRPLFQLETSADQKIDWRQEREWRVVGDVDLKKIAIDEAIVFAGAENDLAKLSGLSLFDLIAI